MQIVEINFQALFQNISARTQCVPNVNRSEKEGIRSLLNALIWFIVLIHSPVIGALAFVLDILIVIQNCIKGT
jgi:hypothetical protein